MRNKIKLMINYFSVIMLTRNFYKFKLRIYQNLYKFCVENIYILRKNTNN
jgi:hypothetical protein